MKAYEFSIVASGLDHEADDFIDRFFEAGCDDATVAYARGSIIVSFCREAVSLEEAVRSATQNVRATGAAVERVEPDSLVSLAEIAKRAGLTRSALSNYAHGLRGANFPRPIARITTDNPLYDWPTVASWLLERGQISGEAAHEAVTLKALNEEIGATRASA
ncbi:hypothetical protein [Marinicauda pacifica]|uniref:hypothetical protein n=1 Tax=Marinicauda pacifica TaxID=1133559 RepID=UPI0035C86CD8